MMQEPDLVGEYGKAYDVHEVVREAHEGTTDQPHAGIANWLIEAPGQTPFWSWFRLSCVHLRHVEGLGDASVFEPGATHEWILVAMDPREFDPEAPMTWSKFLTPFNFVGQYIVGEDETAVEITKLAALGVVNGLMWAEPPLSGQTEPWHTALQNTIAHIRDGHHGDN